MFTFIAPLTEGREKHTNNKKENKKRHIFSDFTMQFIELVWLINIRFTKISSIFSNALTAKEQELNYIIIKSSFVQLFHKHLASHKSPIWNKIK